MSAITPEFLFELEKNMRVVGAEEFQRLNTNLWWNRVAKRLPSGSKAERLIWLLDTANIQRLEDGQVRFSDLVSVTTEYENLFAGNSLKLKKAQMEDLENGVAGGEALRLSAAWMRQTAALSAYWPQKQVAAAIRANGTTYDTKTFFATDHPVNPFNTGAGTFANRFTSTASGIYPGALPIDSATVTVDEAVANIAKAIAYIASIKMPNGEDPRMLRLGGIMVPPALTARAQQITNAKFIAQAAGSAAGSGDIEAVVRNFGLGQPIEAPELASAFTGGSDTSYYLIMEDITTSELGAFTYVDREPFSVAFHGPQTSAELTRKREFEWHNAGRNVVGNGHPYLLFRCEAT
jgi:phage major head subunit gpT-like protein